MFELSRRALALAAITVSIIATPLSGQAIYGAAEMDDDDVAFFLLGGSWTAPGMGWRPTVSLSAYHLRFPSGASTFDRNVILPSVGLTNRTAHQSVNFNVGYAFADADTPVPVVAGAETGDGVVISGGWNHWGTGTHALQLLGSYNLGSEFLWTRGRASRPLTATSPLWVGGEAALMGGGTGDVFLAQFGPTLEYRVSPQFRFGGSAGLKAGISNASGSAVYGRLEFLWLPTAR